MTWDSTLIAFAGAFVGGGMTLLGSWLAIRHDRKIRAAEKLDDCLVQLFDATSRLLQVRLEMTGSDQPDDLAEEHRCFLDALVAVGMRSRRIEPELHDVVTALREANADADDPIDPVIVIACRNLVEEWLADAKQFRRRSRRVGFDSLIAVARGILEDIDMSRVRSGSAPVAAFAKGSAATSE